MVTSSSPMESAICHAGMLWVWSSAIRVNMTRGAVNGKIEAHTTCDVGLYFSVDRSPGHVYTNRAGPDPEHTGVANRTLHRTAAGHHLWFDGALRSHLSHWHLDVRQKTDLAGNYEVDTLRIKRIV